MIDDNIDSPIRSHPMASRRPASTSRSAGASPATASKSASASGPAPPAAATPSAGPGPAPKPYHHGNLKATLVEAARALLREQGPEGLSFRALARAAGVSQAAPYNHFSGKEALLATLATDGFRQLAEVQVRAASAASPGLDRLVALAISYVHFARHNASLYRLMFGAGNIDRHDHPVVAEVKDASFQPVHQALAECAGSGAAADLVEAAAVSCWSQVHGLSMLIIDGSLSARAAGDREVRKVVTLFSRGTLAALGQAGSKR